LHDLGIEVFCSDDVITRIVDCAHYGKIITAQDIVRETKWADASEYGDEIIDIIVANRPLTPSPPGTPPTMESQLFTFDSQPAATQPPVANRPSLLAVLDEHAASGSSTTGRKQSQCSKCGQLGHIASNKKLCPVNLGIMEPRPTGRQTTSSRNKENTLPPSS